MCVRCVRVCACVCVRVRCVRVCASCACVCMCVHVCACVCGVPMCADLLRDCLGPDPPKLEPTVQLSAGQSVLPQNHPAPIKSDHKAIVIAISGRYPAHPVLQGGRRLRSRRRLRQGPQRQACARRSAPPFALCVPLLSWLRHHLCLVFFLLLSVLRHHLSLVFSTAFVAKTPSFALCFPLPCSLPQAIPTAAHADATRFCLVRATKEMTCR